MVWTSILLYHLSVPSIYLHVLPQGGHSYRQWQQYVRSNCIHYIPALNIPFRLWTRQSCTSCGAYTQLWHIYCIHWWLLVKHRFYHYLNLASVSHGCSVSHSIKLHNKPGMDLFSLFISHGYRPCSEIAINSASLDSTCRYGPAQAKLHLTFHAAIPSEWFCICPAIIKLSPTYSN